MEFDGSPSSPLRGYYQSHGKSLRTFELFRRIEFSSDRKRMSILVKDPDDGKIKLYVKGADSIIMDRLNKNALRKDPYAQELLDETKDFVDKEA